MSRSLADWLSWQQSLHPRQIDLGLDRVRRVLDRLHIATPAGRVFAIAGTNGKGTTAHYLAALMAASGWRPGVYSSPHLVRYNERIRLGDRYVADAELISAFEAVEAARQGESLTYFEFGTLAAAWLFAQGQLDAWVLEVGLGGRLDAVNAIEPDFSLITGVDLDHQDWLGDSIEAIAAEKAGILRGGRPGFFGGAKVPDSLRRHAADIGAELRIAGRDFGYEISGSDWRWWLGNRVRRPHLPLPTPGDDAVLGNISLALAGGAVCDETLVDPQALGRVLAGDAPAGRFQHVTFRQRDWLLDVAHNPQAARVLGARLDALERADRTTVVIGMHASKDTENIVRPLSGLARRWIVCRAGEAAGADPADLARRLRTLVLGDVAWRDAPADALLLALAGSRPGDLVVVCGSFEVVGPSLEWLGAAPGD
jgi:dihydrofolate synthase/folylpolyglutamate synthase